MFDTIHLKTPLVCPGCGHKAHTYQTHAFEDVMEDYAVGSVVHGSVLSGIVQESFWCSVCYKAGTNQDSPVYLVVWHSILVGVEQDLSKAEARLSAVDRLDLIGWLDEAQRHAKHWERQFYGLFHDVQRWHEHLEEQKNPKPNPEGESPEQTQHRKALSRLWGLPDEILCAPDPLAALVEKHKPEQGDKHSDDFQG